MAAGFYRAIDDMGRIVIPMEIRRAAGIGPGDYLSIMPAEEGLILKKTDMNREGICSKCNRPL